MRGGLAVHPDKRDDGARVRDQSRQGILTLALSSLNRLFQSRADGQRQSEASMRAMPVVLVQATAKLLVPLELGCEVIRDTWNALLLFLT